MDSRCGSPQKSPNQYIDPLDVWVPTDGVFLARPLQRFDPGGEGTWEKIGGVGLNLVTSTTAKWEFDPPEKWWVEQLNPK